MRGETGSAVIDRRAATLLLLGLFACGYAPARYAARPPVRAAQDDRPIPLPAPRLELDELYHAEAYLDASLVDGLELSLPERAEDVNSRDEVVRSSWFRGGPVDLAGYERSGPPQPPLTVTADATLGIEGLHAVEDARGLGYQIIFTATDPVGATAALPVASRLAHALGYRVAEAHAIETPGGQRAVALRWPVGHDLGPTPMLWTRPDDPNDQIAHVARRSLRATWVLAAWLGIGRFGEASFRDVYLGEPGAGHVQHWLVGLEGALGAAHLADNVEDAFDPSRDDVGFWGRLGTLGLTPLPPPPPTEPTLPGIGILPRTVEPDFDVRPPFAPHRRLRPDDAYWLVRRLLAIDDATLVRAIAAASLPPGTSSALRRRLHERRHAVADRVLAAVTPVDLSRQRGARLVLRDVEHAAGIARSGRRGYHAVILDGDGDALASPRLAVRGSTLHVDLPPLDTDYAILRLWRLDGEARRPRALEVHLGPDPITVRGVRH